MNKVLMALSCLALAAGVQAQEAYKCKVNGTLVIQDRPCVGAVKRSDDMPKSKSKGQPSSDFSGVNAAASSSEKSENLELSEIERQKKYIATREKDRKISDLKSKIESSEHRISSLQTEMISEINQIDGQRSYAKNNLAGATYLNSLANEKQAVTQRYETDIATERDRLKNLREDLAREQSK